MKPFVSALLAALLLLAPLTACGQKGPKDKGGQNPPQTEESVVAPPAAEEPADEVTDAEAYAEAEHALLSDWFNYLQYEELQTRDMLWVLDHIEQAVRSPSRDTLLRALTVLETAALYVAQRPLAAGETTDGQYALLSERIGADAFMVRMNAADAENDGDSEQLYVQRTDLSIRFFMASAHPSMEEELSLLRELYAARLEDNALSTGYLLLLLGESENTAKLRSFVRGYLPLTEAYMQPSDCTRAELKYLESEVLDRMEETIASLNEFTKLRENDLLILNGALQGDDAVLKNDCVRLDGPADCIPAPSWYYADEISCVWLLPNGEVYRAPDELEVLAENPARMLMTCSDVRREELLAYARALENAGWDVAYRQENEKIGCTATREGLELQMLWSGGEASFTMTGELPCLVPMWYAPPDA